MKEKRILDVLGKIDDRYVEELLAPGQAVSRRRPVKRLWLIAAVVAAMVFLMGCAVYVLNLEGMLVFRGSYTEDTGETFAADTISLQGFVDSSNYQAAMEWLEFQQTYDPDLEIMKSLSNEEMEMPLEYYSYNCYTTEMTDKIDEICEKYGLNKQGMPVFGTTTGQLFDAIRIEGILAETEAETKLSPEYYYQTGTFSLSCETVLTGEDSPWVYPIEYQYRCVMKSDFDEVFLNIGDLESYEQWTYTTADGTQVLLALSPDKALVIVDMENAFVTMNILNPRVGDILYGEQMMSREALEAFADTFDFSFVPQPVSDEDWEAVQERMTDREQAYLEKEKEALKSIGGESYAGRVRYLLDNAPRPELLNYALLDIDGDGAEELLIAREKKIVCIYTVDGDMTANLLEWPVGVYSYNQLWEETGMHLSPSYMYLCEGNAIACVYQEGDGLEHYHFAVPADGEMVWMEEIVRDWENTAFYEYTMEEGSNKGYNDICTPISEERYWEILGSYVPVKNMEWTPLSEYPME